MLYDSRTWIFTLVLGFFSLSGCQPATQSVETKPDTSSVAVVKEMVSMLVSIPSQQDFVAEVAFEEGMKVGMLLDRQKVLSVDFKAYPGMGRLVTGMNDLKNEDIPEHYWQFCINGTVSDKGIDDKVLQARDQVAWYFVKYGETP
ncbi:MAG TPA: DUF4430 domain-containing protein, partial [Bacteroidetes bacterium]|nr:DUF4430 domain-containing protein [Bacteroidota bacterium]